MMEDPNPFLSTMQRLQGSMRGYVFLDDGSLYTLTNIVVIRFLNGIIVSFFSV